MKVLGEWIHFGFCRYGTRVMNGKRILMQNGEIVDVEVFEAVLFTFSFQNDE